VESRGRGGKPVFRGECAAPKGPKEGLGHKRRTGENSNTG